MNYSGNDLNFFISYLLHQLGKNEINFYKTSLKNLEGLCIYTYVDMQLYLYVCSYVCAHTHKHTWHSASRRNSPHLWTATFQNFAKV